MAVVVEKLKQEILIRQGKVEKAVQTLHTANKELAEAVTAIGKDVKTCLETWSTATQGRRRLRSSSDPKAVDTLMYAIDSVVFGHIVCPKQGAVPLCKCS